MQVDREASKGEGGRRKAGKAAIPATLERLIKGFDSLPSVGPVAAERLAFHVLGASEKEVFALARAVEALSENIFQCRECGNVGSSEICGICSDDARDRGVLLVVETVEHLALFEKTGKYLGLYHVLGPVPKKEPEKTPGIESLAERFGKGGFRELVIALNPTEAGDGAAREIALRIGKPGVAVSRIGQGIVPGGSFSSADAEAVAESIETRVPSETDLPASGMRQAGGRGIPAAIAAAVEEFNRLPGIGTRTAEHIVFHLVSASLRGSEDEDETPRGLADAVKAIKTRLGRCSVCSNVGDADPCEVCSDPSRDRGVICVVAHPQDALRIECTGSYEGTYHVLGGLFSPLDGVEEGDLNLKNLSARLGSGDVREVIIATDPTFAGDGTALLVRDVAEKARVKATRIGTGVLRGGDLRFASTLQLENALGARKPLREKAR